MGCSRPWTELGGNTSETLIGENIPPQEQGKVYGSHFAFSHLWWAIAYPIAGFLGNRFPANNLLYGGITTITFLGLIFILFNPKRAN